MIRRFAECVAWSAPMSSLRLALRCWLLARAHRPMPLLVGD
jgi:hypothetical protein